MSADTFAGFPAAGVQFLRDLRANNTKLWFEAHRADYLAHVQRPAVALVAALGQRLQERFPDIRYDTRTNGAGTLMRAHRDVRFSADKSPYKVNVAMIFVQGGEKKMAAPGFGMQITPEQVDLMAGVFSFTPDALAAYRAAVLDEALGAQLEQAIAAVRAAAGYSIAGETYRRVPAGLPADHPRAGLLRHTGLHAFAPPIALELAATPQFVDAAMARFETMAPVQQWLARTIYA